MRKLWFVVALVLLMTIPLMVMNGCSKKQEAETEIQQEQVQEAPADTTAPDTTTAPPPPAPES